MARGGAIYPEQSVIGSEVSAIALRLSGGG